MATHVMEVAEGIVPREVLRELYEKMLQCYYVEERAQVFLKQGRRPSTPRLAGTSRFRSACLC